MATEDAIRTGWADPDTRTTAALVIGCVALLVVVGVVFRDVNPS